MNKLLVILPYIYFMEPVQLDSIQFLGLPDLRGRNHAPSDTNDRKYLTELIKCFPISRGLESNKGILRAFTYFLVNNDVDDDKQLYNEARKAVTLLRYMMLRPDSQRLDDFETSAVYTFELPPAGNQQTHIYHGLVNFNQEEWITPIHHKFYPPGWYVDLVIESSSNLEDLEQINQRFYGKVLDNHIEANILLAMEWYNLSFMRYSPRGIEGRLVDISIAFETLFRLQENNTNLYDCVNQVLNVAAGTPLERWSRDFFGKVRSATMHFGKPATLIFEHQEASEGHISFLWSAQRIIRECIAVKAGLNRKISNEHLIEELTPNEVLLKNLKALGSYEKIKSEGQLELWKLRPRYPVGDKDDIIWLGKTLLSEMARQLSTKKLPTLSSAIDAILASDSNDKNLWSKYVELSKLLTNILFRNDSAKVKELSDVVTLAYDVSHFAEFAWYALSMLTFRGKTR
ncbi:hypothetical protein ACFLYR_05730 [Chloroflexota bacterium]